MVSQAPLYDRVRQILESARTSVSRTVNTTQVVSNWLVGREIVEEEQSGKTKAKYGVRLLQELSLRLKREFGNGYSVDNLELFRRFYQEFPSLISETPTWKLPQTLISDALRRKLPVAPHAQVNTEIFCAPRMDSWSPGQLHLNLSWTHYRTLLRSNLFQFYFLFFGKYLLTI